MVDLRFASARDSDARVRVPHHHLISLTGLSTLITCGNELVSFKRDKGQKRLIINLYDRKLMKKLENSIARTIITPKAMV